MRAPEYDGGPMKATAEVNRSWFALAIGQISYAPRIVVLRRGGRRSAPTRADRDPPPCRHEPLLAFAPAMLLCMGWFFLVSPLALAAKSHAFTQLLLAGLFMFAAYSTAKWAMLTADKVVATANESTNRGRKAWQQSR